MKEIVEKISDNITHVSFPLQNLKSSEEFVSNPINFLWNNECVLRQSDVRIVPKKELKFISDSSDLKKKMTANGEVSYTDAMRGIPSRDMYSIELKFAIGDGELLLGMGQYEDGIWDYRNRTEYLYESNMRIAIPFLVTTGHYGILIDSESCQVFKSEGNEITFMIDCEKAAFLLSICR